MAVNTVVCLYLSAGGMMAVACGRTFGIWLASILIAGVAAATGARHVFESSPRIDSWWWPSRLDGGAAIPFGQMAPNAVLGFLLVALALPLMAARRRLRSVLTMIGVGVLALAVHPLLSYLASVTESGATYQAMALTTIAGLTIIAAAILRSAAQTVGAEDSFFPPLLATAVSLLLAIGVVAVQTNDALIGAGDRVVRSYKVTAALERLVARVARMESTARGYVISGQTSFRDGSLAHQKILLGLLDELDQLLVENPEQGARMRQMRPKAEAKIALNAAVLEARAASSDLAIPLQLLIGTSNANANGLIDLANEVRAEEARLLQQRETEMAALTKSTRAVQIFGSLLALALVGLTVSQTWRAGLARRAADEALQQRVTELAAARAELEKASRLQRAVLDGTGESLISTTADGCITIFNAGAEKMLGYSRDEAVGRLSSIALHVPAELEARAAELSIRSGRRIEPGLETLAYHARAGAAVEQEWTYVRKDRTHVAVSLGVTALRDETGTITGFLTVARDLTERRRAEAALRESEQQLRLVFESTSIGLKLLKVAEGRREALHNPAFSRLTGVSPEEELQPDAYRERTVIEDLPAQDRALEALRRGETDHFEMEKRYRHADGTVVWAHVTRTRQPLGRPGEYLEVGSVVDITERKKLEESLAAARDQALEGSRLKSEFLATMSHEIRTPMNAVMGMATLLADTRLDAEQTEMVRTLAGGAESLLAIINDILDFSRIEAGKLRLDPADFDFGVVLEETAALLAPRAHLKGVELTCEWERTPRALLCGDSGRVRQILMNLIGNAVKFTEAGEVAIHADVVHDSERRTRVRVSVRDTGVGIPREAQGRLFQPFTQADGSSTRRFGGAGLGLAISRQLVELMGGQIGFESEPGRGSTFTVELEFAPSGAPAAGTRPTLPPGHRVLVVDDHAPTRRILLAQLARAGVDGVEAADAPAALARLRDPARPVDLVLFDRDLPAAGGRGLAAEIRADPVLAAVPLVVLSPPGPAADFGSTAGFAGCLMKPVAETQLVRSLARVLIAAKLDEKPAVAPAKSGLRFLLVEDNPANQQVAILLLGRMGHGAELATDGAAALGRLAAEAFDAVLMDCQLPVFDGYETARRIRSGTLPGVNPRVPIIALTAYARAEDRARCFEAGMNDYVAKPIRPAELRAALERCGLGGKTAAATETGGPALDREAFETVRDLPGARGGSLATELIGLYLSGEAERLARLATLVGERIVAPLAAEAHQFGGTAASFGGAAVRGAALALERAVRAEDWPEAEIRLAELRVECGRLRTELRRVVGPVA